MQITEIRAQLKARIWQAIAQSGVSLTAISQADAEKLVDSITDNVLIGLDETLERVRAEAVAPPDAPEAPAEDDEERVLWEGRPMMSLVERYQVTSERIRLTRGVLGKEREDIELVRVQDVDHKQSITERMMNVGDIYVRSHDPSHPEIVLRNVKDPLEVHEIIRRAVIAARKKYRLSYREEM